MFCHFGIARKLLLFGLLAGLNFRSAQADPHIYRYLLSSTVYITADGQGLGSGVLVDLPNRLVVTACHVVEKLDEVQVVFPVFDGAGELATDEAAYIADSNATSLRDCGALMRGHVVAKSKEKDLALVQLEMLPCEPQAIPLAESSCEAGDNVHIVGNPALAMWVYTPGRVRNVAKRQQYISEDQLVDAYIVNTSCPSDPGDSGGPVINDNGELVGIHSHRTPQQRLGAGEIDVREVRMLLEWYIGGQYDRELATGGPGQP